MPAITGDKREDGKIRVWQIHHKLDSHPNGYSVDENDIPQFPDYKPGVEPVMIYDPEAKEFSFEEKSRPLTEAEALLKIAEAIEKLVNK